MFITTNEFTQSSVKSLSLPKTPLVSYYIPTQISKQISQDTSDEEALRGKTLVFDYYPPYQDPSSRLQKNRYRI